MPGLAFDKFIVLLFILLVGVGICLTWPLETQAMLRVALGYLPWAWARG